MKKKNTWYQNQLELQLKKLENDFERLLDDAILIKIQKR